MTNISDALIEIEMYFVRNLCVLCLSKDYKLTSQRNLIPSITEIFGYFIPEYTFQNLEIPIQICDNCLKILKNICDFRQKCLESIKTYIEIGVTGIRNIQEVEKIKSEPNVDENISNEMSETDYCNPQTENYQEMSEEMVGKLGKVEFQVKKEINEEIMIKEDIEDLHIFEHEISNNSEINNMENTKEQNEYIPLNDSNEFDCQTTHADTGSTDGRERIETDEGLYECDVCRKTFESSDHIKRHYQVHSGEKPYSIEICHQLFSDPSAIETHKGTHSEKHPPCEICHKSFANAFDMKSHRCIDNSIKEPHKCSICHKTFTQLVHLKRHIHTHSGEKPYSCSTCQKQFSCSSILKRHDLVHRDKKPYVCEICQKSFGNASNIRRHKRTHTGEKPHVCEICHKSFCDYSNMKRHRATHGDVIQQQAICE